MRDLTPGPEPVAINTELRSKLEAAIGTLSEDLRTAVVLRDVQQLSTEEAADVLDISIPAFKARLHRGRLALREQLASYLKSTQG